MVKRVVLMAALVMSLMLVSASSFATNVTYSTTGTFAGTDLNNTGGAHLQNGTASIFFQGQTSTTVGANPTTGVALGVFTIIGGSGTFAAGALDTFTLNITQTAPVGGTGSTTTAIAGTIQGGVGGSNTIQLSFVPTTVQIDGISYILNSTYFLPAPTTSIGGGLYSSSLTVQGSVSAVPEPGSMMLLGTGLTGLAGVVRRRFKK